MKLLQLNIKNFRSFKEEQTFDFRDAGLHFLTGVNQAEERLGANGAGKSTVWDALCWVLYGKTLRGLKAGDVSNWEAKTGTQVSLFYDDGFATHLLTRTWNPNSWQLDCKDIVEDETNPALAALKLNFLAATHSIFMAQQQPMFLDMKAADKASLLAEVLDLDLWLTLSDQAKEKQQSMLDAAYTLSVTIARNEGVLESLRGEDFVQEAIAWEESLKSQIDERRIEIDSTVLIANQAKSRIAELKRKPRIDTRQLEADLRKLQDKHKVQCTIPLGILENDLRRLDAEIQSFKEGGGKCPTCGTYAPVSAAENLVALKHEREQLLAKEESLKKIDKFSYDTLVDKQKRLTQATDTNRELDNTIRELSRQLSNAEKLIDELQFQIDALRDSANPFQEREEAAAMKLFALVGEQKSLEEERISVQYQAKCYEYWVSGFKELRLRMISESLHQLEMEVNSCLLELGMVNWELRFDVEKETKKGNKQIGFNVLVISPTNDKPVPWEVWSGGESQRLRIAATMGLANLIRSSTGATLNLEVWDEPTQFMGVEGVEDLLTSLRERANRERRQIWVVDHRSLGFGSFDSTTVITKTTKGSQIS